MKRHRRSTPRRIAAAGLVLLGACLLPEAASAGIKVQATALEPLAFKQAIKHYTTSCDAPTDIRVRTQGRMRLRARIGAGRWFAGTRTRRVQLVPGQAIRIAKRLQGKPGSVRKFFIRCLPDDFTDFTFTRNLRPRKDLYLVSPMAFGGTDANYTFVLNRHGVPVWWTRTSPQSIDAKILTDGSIAYARWGGGGYGTDPDAAYEIRALSGKLIRELRTVGTPTDHHELLETETGNYMLLSYRPREGVDATPHIDDSDATILDSVVQEITPAGELVFEWSSADHIELSETGRWLPNTTREPYDTTHINAAELLPNGDFMVSMRQTDAVYRVDRDTGEIVWKLGGTATAESLTVVGDPYMSGPFPTPVAGQHDIRHAGGNEITVFDNESGLPRPPRAARFRIEDDTATLVDMRGDATQQSSGCCGSARYSADDSWLISWGGSNLVSELDTLNRQTFTLEFEPGVLSYRAVAADEYVGIGAFRRGMAAREPNAR